MPVRVSKLFRGVTLSVNDPVAVAMIREMNARAECVGGICALGAGLWGLRAKLRYELDPDDVDRYAPYMVSVSLGYADCSSMTVAIDAHAFVSGMPVAALTIAQADPVTGVVGWSHVLGAALIDGVWVTADVSERYVPVGWRPQAWRVRDSRLWIYDSEEWSRWYRDGANDDALPVAQPSRPL